MLMPMQMSPTPPALVPTTVPRLQAPAQGLRFLGAAPVLVKKVVRLLDLPLTPG